MAALFNQTNIASYTTQFITRKEVADGFSTLAGDLSGVNLSTLFLNPNPQVSTLSVNPTGLVSGYAAAQYKSVNLSTTQKLGLTNLGTYLGAITAIADGSPNTAPVVGLGFKAELLTNNNNQTRIDYNFNQITGTPDAVNFAPMATYNPGAANPPWVLSNISTINGIPPNTTGTTFTTLTGSNLTTTGTLTSPQIVSVSSINGLPYQALYTGQVLPASTNYPITLTSNIAAVVASITLPAGYLQPNTTYLYDVPFAFLSYPTGGGFPLNIGIRLGNNGQINYQYPLMMVPGAQGFGFSLTGIAQTNAASVGSQQIQIIAAQFGAASFSCTFQSPPSAGGANVFSIKPLS